MLEQPAARAGRIGLRCTGVHGCTDRVDLLGALVFRLQRVELRDDVVYRPDHRATAATARRRRLRRRLLDNRSRRGAASCGGLLGRLGREVVADLPGGQSMGQSGQGESTVSFRSPAMLLPT